TAQVDQVDPQSRSDGRSDLIVRVRSDVETISTEIIRAVRTRDIEAKVRVSAYRPTAVFEVVRDVRSRSKSGQHVAILFEKEVLLGHRNFHEHIAFDF